MDLQYPIGRFAWSGPNSEDDRKRYMDEIEGAPSRLRAAVAGLSDAQLDTPYRPGGWTVRQVVHHVPDSHLNMYGPPQSCKRKTEKDSLVCANVFGL